VSKEMNPSPKDTGKPRKWKGTELWRIPMQTGYDAFAVIRFDEESGFIRIVEELPDGTQMGCYVNFERHPSSYLALERKLAERERQLMNINSAAGAIVNESDILAELESVK
jgi:hypothetical protein